MSEPKHPVLTGGCQCGAIRYAITAPPEHVHLCHCRACQKAVGGLFAALAPAPRSGFAWTRGTPASFASPSIAHRDFCARCGTPLSFRYNDADTIAVTLGSLDRPQDVPPVRYYGSRAASLGLTTSTRCQPRQRRNPYRSKGRKNT